MNITLKTFSFKNRAENDAGTLDLDLFLIFKKALPRVKASDLHFSYKYILVDFDMDIQ